MPLYVYVFKNVVKLFQALLINVVILNNNFSYLNLYINLKVLSFYKKRKDFYYILCKTHNCGPNGVAYL